jgi:hypothetical protein
MIPVQRGRRDGILGKLRVVVSLRNRADSAGSEEEAAARAIVALSVDVEEMGRAALVRDRVS